ncbi:hypothetical protein KKJ25_09360 [Xenorhabdus bovienii]|nr:hypothetical protein [Xenorhabdus bovienii]MDE9473231.1 hypothetical protein [Xenorhabdus bovienii]
MKNQASSMTMSIGELDIRKVDLKGVKLESYQVAELLERIGIVVMD